MKNFFFFNFKRFLTTELRFTSNDTSSGLFLDECRLMLLESFDKNLYVDVYELRQKIYDRMFTFYLSNKVNTETAGYKSQNFQAFVYLAKSKELLNCSRHESDKTITSTRLAAVNCTLTIKLPIHVRYHSPKIPLGDACNESSLSLVAVSAPEDEKNRTELNQGDNGGHGESDESAAVSGETNGYFRFNIRKPRLFFTPMCSFSTTTNDDMESSSQQQRTTAKIGGVGGRPKTTSSNRAATKSGNQESLAVVVELDLPCQKNKSVRNDYLFAVAFSGDEMNATNKSAEWIANKYSSVCKWREYRFEKV